MEDCNPVAKAIIKQIPHQGQYTLAIFRENTASGLSNERTKLHLQMLLFDVWCLMFFLCHAFVSHAAVRGPSFLSCFFCAGANHGLWFQWSRCHGTAWCAGVMLGNPKAVEGHVFDLRAVAKPSSLHSWYVPSSQLRIAVVPIQGITAFMQHIEHLIKYSVLYKIYKTIRTQVESVERVKCVVEWSSY